MPRVDLSPHTLNVECARGFGREARSAPLPTCVSLAAGGDSLVLTTPASGSSRSLDSPVPLAVRRRRRRSATPRPTIMSPAKHRKAPMATIEETKVPMRCTNAPTTKGPRNPAAGHEEPAAGRQHDVSIIWRVLSTAAQPRQKPGDGFTATATSTASLKDTDELSCPCTLHA